MGIYPSNCRYTQYLLSIGLDNVGQHNQALVNQLVDGLNKERFDLISPHLKKERTNIVVFSCKDASQNSPLFEFLKGKGFYLALWRNKLRVSPHIYNTLQEMEGLLKTLAQFVSKVL